MPERPAEDRGEEHARSARRDAVAALEPAQEPDGDEHARDAGEDPRPRQAERSRRREEGYREQQHLAGREHEIAHEQPLAPALPDEGLVGDVGPYQRDEPDEER